MIKTTATIKLTSKEEVWVYSSCTMAMLAIQDISRKIEEELDNSYSDWSSINIEVVKIKE